MRPAPEPNEDETHLEEDALVADPLSDRLLNLLNTTAGINREVFSEVFRSLPSNKVHNWAEYKVRWHYMLGLRVGDDRPVGIYAQGSSGSRRTRGAAPPCEGAACARTWINCRSTARTSVFRRHSVSSALTPVLTFRRTF
jgi:hypothetical protein